jgi:huntingtin
MATDLLTESNPVVVVPALQLFLTCMYTMNPGEVEGNEDDPDAMANPEMLMQAMERMSILFDCVRRLGPEEAGLLCDILPKVLFDFFPAADVVNRVISEFISPGQPHQVFISELEVIFAMFTRYYYFSNYQRKKKMYNN